MRLGQLSTPGTIAQRLAGVKVQRGCGLELDRANDTKFEPAIAEGALRSFSMS